MGAYLSAPITLKESEDGATSRLRHGASSMQGWRRSMEDAHIVGTEKAGATLYGVFDGHGGAEVARYVARHMAEDFPEDWSANPEQALKGLFHRMDERLRLPENQPELASLKNGATAPGAGQLQGANAPAQEEEEEGEKVSVKEAFALFQQMIAASNARQSGDDEEPQQEVEQRPQCSLPDHPLQAGCTSVVVAATPDTLWCANAGDSRAVVCRDGVAIPLSFDHKPNSEIESTRITKAGGFVEATNGFFRVNGNLNLSRSIGDLKYKQSADLKPEDQIITAEPDVLKHTLDPKDEFFIVACDGVWDVLSNQEAVDFVRTRIQAERGQGREPQLSKICEAVFDRCIATNPRETRGIGGDNMTCVVVEIPR
jgi:protein phosphatase 1G